MKNGETVDLYEDYVTKQAYSAAEFSEIDKDELEVVETSFEARGYIYEVTEWKTPNGEVRYRHIKRSPAAM